jgi:release factor glutamine methyltransferase
MEKTGLVCNRRVLDLCSGTGIAAIAAAELGAAAVTAFDICPRAVRCSRANARNAGVVVEIRQEPWTQAFDCAPFDVIVANPPYVPAPPAADTIPSAPAPATWNGGCNGRAVLDPLCVSASHLLSVHGSLLVVQSAFADAHQSLSLLRSTGLNAEVVATQWVPFGPVLSALAGWLERTARIRPDCREEQLVVVRADKP